MATSAELEALKEKIRKMAASAKKGDAIYEALILWMPLQSDGDWLRLINEKTKSLNQREIAAELCGSDNIWKRERFRALLDDMNASVIERGLVKKVMPCIVDEVAEVKEYSASLNCSVEQGNPIEDLAEMRLKTKLKQTECMLHQATLRVKNLEKELKKFTDLA